MLKKTLILMLLTLFISTLTLAAAKKVFPADKGPSSVNVSKYPADVQAAYKVFTKKCSKCHTIARPINTTMSAAQWQSYANKMSKKPSSGISAGDVKTILKFLLYDQKNRKDKNPSAFKKPVTIK